MSADPGNYSPTTSNLTLGAAALAWAVTKLGITETSNNSGPDIDAWLAGVGLDPGYPWCAAFAFAAFQAGAGALGIACPVPCTASTLAMWARATQAQTQTPQPGAIYVLQHSPHTGHVGIVEQIDEAGNVLSEISGNTNEAGMREGNAVWRHDGPPEKSHGGTLLGYLWFG